MDWPEEHIDHLISRHLDGEASNEEQKALNEWLEVGENRKHFDAMKRLHERVQASLDHAVPRVDVDAAWEKVKARTNLQLQAEPKVIEMPSRSNRSLWLSIAAILVIGLGVGYFFQLQTGVDPTIQPMADMPVEMIEVTDAINEDETVNIPDRSKVILKEGSKLTYPKTFDPKVRELALEGEAFFDVARDTARPFVITAGVGRIKVLGTSFSVEDLDHQLTRVTVKTGRVMLYSSASDLLEAEEFLLLEAGDQGTIDATGHLEKLVLDDPNAFSIYDGRLRFDNQRLGDIIDDLERHFKVKIEVVNAAILDCPVTAKFEQSSLDEVLESIELLFDIRSHQENGVVELDGEGC